jgi:hypothetical protein
LALAQGLEVDAALEQIESLTRPSAGAPEVSPAVP